VLSLLRVVLGSALLVVALWCALVLSIFLFGRRDEARPADAIVVLGAAQWDGRPSPVLRARVDHAMALFQDGVAPLVIFTGGVGVGDTVSEAEAARRYAVRSGLPEAALQVERSGLSTGESMRSAVEMMLEQGLESAVLVSDPFHMLRLRLFARRLGIRAYSSPTRTSPIAHDSPNEWRHILRESLIVPVAYVTYR
jgi:uncharacterized SAM-binding protein YcdF (DUF218 family)